MTPKTAQELEITALSASLAPLCQEMHLWAEKSVFLKWGVLSRGRFHCLDCMHTWKPDRRTKSCLKFTKCASCGGKLKMFAYNQVQFREIEYCAVLDTAGIYQVVRIICSRKQMKKNALPTFFHCEVMQHFISPQGAVRTMSRSTNVFSAAYDAWQYHSALEIRPKDFQNSPKYRLVPYRVYPKAKIVPALRRNGFKTAFHNIAPQVLFTALLRDSLAETLLKASQISMLRYYLCTPEQHIRENWQTVKVCLKNRYVIQDYGIWEDYIALLRWFKKDLRCPLFVCPEDLAAAHDRLAAKKRAIQRKEYLLKMRSEIMQAQKVYAQEKKDFFGLRFEDKNLCISVIENVQDFMLEGDSLHHCVFANEYHKKKNSLILSAKLGSQSIETIEVSLQDMQVIQCRGMKNNHSKYHRQIMGLISRNLPEIRRRMQKKKIKTV